MALIDSVKSAEVDEVREDSNDREAREVGSFKAEPEAVTEWEGVSVESHEPEERGEFDAIIEAVGLLDEVSDGSSESIGTLESVDEKQLRGLDEEVAQTDGENVGDPEVDGVFESAMDSLETGETESDDSKDVVNDGVSDAPSVEDDETDELSEPVNDELVRGEGEAETEKVFTVDIEFTGDDETDGSDDNETLIEADTDAVAAADVDATGVFEAISEAVGLADTLREDATLADVLEDALSESVDRIDGVLTVDADTSDDGESTSVPLPVLERDTEEQAEAMTLGETEGHDDDVKLRICEGVKDADTEAQFVRCAVSDGIEADARPDADADCDSAGDVDADAHSDAKGLLVREPAAGLRDIASEADTPAVVEACAVTVCAVDGDSESVS